MSDGRETRADHERRLASAQRVAFAMLHEMRNVLNPIVSARMRELLEREAAGEDPAPATDIPSAPGSSPTTAQHP